VTLVTERKKESSRSASISEVLLRGEFKKLQNQMVKLGMKLGLSHPSVIRISQKLDRIHNQLLRMD